ncbi:MAG TPA: ComEC/Rec2 family competence protein, partial [Conexibacter sp.]|nr:ComEC/Rec2 family competence protein [Conexibacter sp.]
MSAALDAALERLREHPRHLVLAAFVAGLAAAPLAPRLVLLLACAAALLAGRPALGLLAALALVAGTLGAQARSESLRRTQLSPLFGTTVAARVELLEQPRPIRYGHTALVQLRALAPARGAGRAIEAGAEGAVPSAGGAVRADADGTAASAAGGVWSGAAAGAVRAGAGERVMLRIGEHVAWPQVATGAVVDVRGRLRALGPFEQYEALRGAHAAISLDAAAATGLARGGPAGIVDGVRVRAERALDAGLPVPQAALLRGMTLGQDDALDARTREEFRVSSLSHVLAASGQNVALLLALALPL